MGRISTLTFPPERLVRLCSYPGSITQLMWFCCKEARWLILGPPSTLWATWFLRMCRKKTKVYTSSGTPATPVQSSTYSSLSRVRCLLHANPKFRARKRIMQPILLHKSVTKTDLTLFPICIVGQTALWSRL